MAAKLEHADEIGFVIFPAADEAAEIMEPGKEALDFPTPTVATQFASVLSAFATAVVLVARSAGCRVFAGGADRADRCRRRGRRSIVTVYRQNEYAAYRPNGRMGNAIDDAPPSMGARHRGAN